MAEDYLEHVDFIFEHANKFAYSSGHQCSFFSITQGNGHIDVLRKSFIRRLVGVLAV